VVVAKSLVPYRDRVVAEKAKTLLVIPAATDPQSLGYAKTLSEDPDGGGANMVA
jgi:hypothetical protein